MTQLLFIPGIKGTQLFEGNHKRWYPSNSKDIEALYSNNDLTPGEPVGRVTIPMLLQDINIYEGFLTYFGRRNLSVFTYDWRKAVMTHFGRLQTLIDSIDGKITIIAHSMGGMLAKAFLLNYPTIAAEKIDRLITIGTPWLGAPDAFKALILGEPLIAENDFTLHALNYYRDAQARSLACDFPSTFELLPSHQYYNTSGGKFFRKFSGKLATWNEIVTRMGAAQFNNNFQNYSLPMHNLMSQPISVTHFALIGYGYATLKALPERTSTRFDKHFASFWNGDGVVPFNSARPPHNSSNYYVKGEHKELCSLPATIEWIDWVLSGARSALPERISNFAPSVKLEKTKLARILCPVSFTLRDDAGRSISGDLDPESIDLTKVNENKDTYVHTIGDAKYVFVKNDKLKEKYEIEIDTYEKGLANISLVDFDGEETDELVTFKSIPVDEGIVLKLSLFEDTRKSDLVILKENKREEIKGKVSVVKDVNEIIFDEDESPIKFEIKVRPAEGVKKSRTLIPVYSGNIVFTVIADMDKISEIFWTLNGELPREYHGETEISTTQVENLLTVIARDKRGNSLDPINYSFIVDSFAPTSIPSLDFDPDGGLGISIKTKEHKAGIKESRFQLTMSNGKSTGWIISPTGQNKVYFPLIEVFGPANGTAKLEFQSSDKFGREEDPLTTYIKIGDLRDLLWMENTSAVTPATIWSNIFENKFGNGKVTYLTKTHQDIDFGANVPDDARELNFITDDVEVKVKFSEQYTLYWSGPPTEVVKRKTKYDFSFQLLTDAKYPVLETEPVVRYYPVSKGGKIVGGGTTIPTELKKDEFVGSFLIDLDYNVNKIKLRVTDSKHKSPPLRETTLIIED